MHFHSHQYFKSRRRELRNNATEYEVLLWKYLRKSRLGCKFERQHSIGPYIVDFYCVAKRLVIELDGVQHRENKEYDQERTRYLESLNYKVLRFWNYEISENIYAVIEKIKQAVDSKE
jgi:very-short-patch-repair endonuclease